MKRLSSLRTTLAPMPSTPIACLPVGPPGERQNRTKYGRLFESRLKLPPRRTGGLFRGLRDLHAGSRIQHRFDDVVVARAAADVAFQLVPDRGLVEIAAMALHDVDRRHDHAGRTESALQPVIIAE